MPMKKHLVEVYRNYNIHVVSGMTPPLFIAEKDDPSKGSTLVNESLDELKVDVDKMLDYATKMQINTWDGPEKSNVFQKTAGFAKSVAGDYVDVVMVITSEYDLEELIRVIDKKALRKSKKHGKTKSRLTTSAILRMLSRTKTFGQ